MSIGNDGELVKIRIDLHDNEFSGESFWARPLGGDEYELRNTPWYAYDLHFYDVVRAIRDSPEELPTIVGIVRRSAHKTLRVVFPPEVAPEDRLEMMKSLNRWRGFMENCNGTLFAVDVEPDGDYEAVCGQLWEWHQEGLLDYETGTLTGEPEPDSGLP